MANIGPGIDESYGLGARAKASDASVGPDRHESGGGGKGRAPFVRPIPIKQGKNLAVKPPKIHEIKAKIPQAVRVHIGSARTSPQVERPLNLGGIKHSLTKGYI
jgi:hypothetical protein